MITTETQEQPIEIQFSILKRGEPDSRGPFTEQDILAQLNAGEITSEDMVFYEGLGEWKPIGEVFEIQEQISHFVDDGQDKQKVAVAFREVSNVVGSEEDIFYIAVQAKAGLLGKTKQCVIVTDTHVFMLHEKRVGYELEAHLWKTVTNTLMRDEGRGLGTFSILLGGEKRVDVCHIPLKQVQRLFQLSQEIKQSID
ncbi:MAG: DUF4339 domain-containing protein [Verrucomicrobiales bacterium]|jgi:hypothetical protein|nr:DUF4339 domain-containing protein [Verrucomicrobiales bacterium]